MFERETKYAVPVTSQFSNNPLPLAGIFELVKTDCSQLHIREIDKLEKPLPRVIPIETNFYPARINEVAF